MTRERAEDILFVARLLHLNTLWAQAVGLHNLSTTAQLDRQWLVTRLYKLCGIEGR